MTSVQQGWLQRLLDSLLEHIVAVADRKSEAGKSIRGDDPLSVDGKVYSSEYTEERIRQGICLE